MTLRSPVLGEGKWGLFIVIADAAAACLAMASHCRGEAASSIELFAAPSALVSNYCLLIALAMINPREVLLSDAMIGIVGLGGSMI